MKAKLLTLGVASAMCTPAISMADTTLYGKAHLAAEFDSTISISENDDGSTVIGDTETTNHIRSRASRIGVKGKEDMGNGLSAVFKFEWQIDMADASKASDDHIKSRNQYVGLAGGFGTVLLGRHDTPLKFSQGKFDLFGDTYGDIARHLSGETRADNVLAYISPSFGNFQIVGAYVPVENADNDSVFSIAGTYNSDMIYAALAHNVYDEDIGVGDSLTRATVTAKFGGFGVGAMFQLLTPTEGDEGSQYAVNGSYKFGANKVKLQYQYGDGELDNTVGIKQAAHIEEAQTISLGFDRKMSKRTTAYVAGHMTSYEDDNKDDESNLALGIIHKF